MSNNPFLSHDISALLRSLALQIDSGDYPDFLLVVSNGDEYFTAHDSRDDVFGLLGAIEYRKSLIISEIE